jgi:hypothetical protein
MPDGLSARATVILVALAFGAAFTLQALLTAGSSAAKPVGKASAPVVAAVVPVVEPDLSLAAAGAVPALRDPRKPVRHKKKPARKVGRKKVAPAPAAEVQPVATPTPTPRYTPPVAQPIRKPAAPKAKPKPTPKATPEPAGEFDTSGEGGA